MNDSLGIMAMPGAGFFSMLIIGMLAGWIAEKVTNSDHGLLTNMIVGIAGSFVGGAIADALGVHFAGWFWGNLLVSAIGAIGLVYVWRAVKDR
ncbi:MAG: GlsB/YeaQ/YmgE family stress response membrane protein [Rhizobiales bacterium]|nr:GlsB/YeaQ/YmgE family stress response membrane protein [Hyphomicrobiales bacterium]